MTDPSLNRRLDQHARRSGFAIGASMAVTIVLLIGAFVWLFAALNPYLSDFFTSEAAPEPTASVVAQAAAGASLTPEPTVAPTATTAVTPTPAPSSEPSDSPEDEDGFQADYRTTGDEPVNFRSAPGTEGSAIIDGLIAGSALQSTGNEETVAGAVWLEFTDENGRVGWIREIDVEPISDE